MTQRTEIALRLLALAQRDMTSFRALTTHPEVDISATGFFAQQVVEKCLKSVAEYHGIIFRKTHDVDELVDLLLQHDVVMPFPPEQFSHLNPFAVILHYEETPFISMSLEEMNQLVDLAFQWASAMVAK